MKIKNNPPRPGIPTHFKDKLVVRYDPKFGAIAQSWPRRNVGGKPRGDPAKVALWDAAIEWVKRPEPSEYNQALQATSGTAFYARDILIGAIYGNYISWPGWGWRVELAQNIQAMLDSITDITGSILYRAEDGWHGLAPGTDAQVLTISGLGAFPSWSDPAPPGITTITGDLDAGPGSGTVTGTLTSTGVTPGIYLLASIQVDAKGRVLDATSNTITPGLDQLTGDVTAGPGSGSQAATLSTTGVSPGTYTFATVTLDAKGRATSASSGSPPAYMNQLTGDVTAGPGSGSQAATLSTTGVSPGTYTFATVTLDAKGRATSASSGSPPAYMNQLTGDVTAGPGSGSQAATLSTTGVTAGTYTNATVTFDSKGRATAASSGTAPTGITELTGDVTAGPGSGSQATTLSTTGVAAGTYTAATITLDAKGRATSASSGSVAPSASIFHPGYKAGRYYGSPTDGGVVSSTVLANTIYARPFYVPIQNTFTKIGMHTQSGPSSTFVNFGIYTNNNGEPGSLIQDFGQGTIAAFSDTEITGLSVPLAPGWYWIVAWFSGTPNITVNTTANSLLGALTGWPTLGGVTPVFALQQTLTYSAGHLPLNFASPPAIALLAPSIRMGM